MREKKVRTVFAVFVLLYCFAPSVTAGGSAEEVRTSFKAGRGYRVGEELQFLVNYRLYRPKTGISRFPDGGIPETVNQGVFLIGLVPEGAYRSERVADTRVLESELYSFEKRFFADYPQVEEFDMNHTNQLVRDIGPAVLGLPSPLDYCEKSRKDFTDDLVKLKGDYLYRKEIIRHLRLTSDEAKDILQAMEKRENDLEGLEQMEYQIFSKDTKTELRKQGGL